ncbi:tetratricopeptide repeat protein [uncultured Flavobacterium sp.]|uniref:ATP-binding protein n=1 Tax=uncultured Flavobacterium sp. TaxID=165435 RepID=UPI0025EA1BED|nr:tetratricopeptide repeat protein [uncultured Flavobacterium sp.]
MKNVILLLFIVFASCSDKKKNFSSNENSDSLSIYFSLANEDTIKYEKRLEYTEKAYDLIKNLKNDSLYRVNLFKVANRYYNMDNHEDYKKTTQIILEKSKKADDSASMAKAFSYMGDYYTKTFTKPDSAAIFYVKSLKIYKNLNDTEKLGSTYASLARLQITQNDFLGAESSAILALKLLKKDQSYVYEAYNFIGITSVSLEDYDKAIEYHTKALHLANSKGLTGNNEVPSSLNNIGSTYQNQGKYKEAIAKFKEALTQKNLIFKDPVLYATLIDNLAYSKFKLEDYSQLPDLFFEALKIRNGLKRSPEIIYNKIHLCEFYATKKDTPTAKKFEKEALALAIETKNSFYATMTLRKLIDIDKKNASKYGREFIAISDSLLLQERKIKNKFARLSFETDDIILQKEVAVQRQWLIFIISGSIVLFGLLLYIIRMQRIRQKESLLIQSQQKASEEIYQLILDQQIQFNEGREKEKKRIAKELHHGVMNKLAGIRFNLFVLQKKTDPETISKCISHISEIQSIEKEIRNITHDLHQDVFFAKNDYAELLKTLTNGLDETVQINAHLEIDENINWEIVPAVIKMHSYRILQESISNAIKHSNAKNLYVSILQDTEVLLLEIRDDGKGFDANQESASLGIKNIKYRAGEMQGKCEISSSSKGTSIAVTIPFKIVKK